VTPPRLPLPVLIGIAVLVAVAISRSDELRERAETGLGEGMPAREAALARGFVLGDDDGVDEETKEDFIRAGLSHLLAVSGENVTLLALLAMPVLAGFSIPLRERLVWTVALIAVYVPLAGSGPSIQRAGVMGAVGLLATLAGRRASRLYALGLAAVVTLAIDPSVAGDVGWQLSFAAVLGILLLASPIRAWLLARMAGDGPSVAGAGNDAAGPRRVRRGGGLWRRALAEGIAVTIAATLATAPLIAHVFEEVSVTSLLANVLALPAVAPAMWLGMVSAALAQIPGVPLAPLNGLDALLLAYIAQVAAWCGRPGWAYLHVELSTTGLIGSYLALAAAAIGVPTLRRHRQIAALRRSRACSADGTQSEDIDRFESRRPAFWRVAAVAGVACALVWAGGRGGADAARPVAGLRVSVLDVGQGDAILFQPAHAPALLVDGGPPGDGLESKLRSAGVERLGVAVVTHEQSDHAGGIEELLGRFPIARLVYARLSRRLRGEAEAAGTRPERLAAGASMRSGRLRVEVLWPPPAMLATPLTGADPNTQALVLLARLGDFSMLLTADAEAESVPLDPGPVDVLKVAHHGSDDAGLDALLDRTAPQLALISVGADNSYGHPTAATLATLAAHGVPTMRTDRDGTIVLDLGKGSVSLSSGG
jgi:competence protein ComEC